MFLVFKDGQYLRLEGVFEYWRLVEDPAHATQLPRSKASTYAGIIGGETVAIS